MARQTLDMGIEAVRRNSLDEGARLIRLALDTGDLSPQVQAVAYLWLAETRPDVAFRQQCYNEALIADPNNADARQRLEALTPAPPPPPASTPEPVPAPPPTVTQAAPPAGMTIPVTPVIPNLSAQVAEMPTATVPTASAAAPPQGGNINIAHYIARIIGGPRGNGTGFFVNAEGLIATTRFVVGGLEHVVVEMHGGRQFQGTVLRAYPELDLALVKIDHNTGGLLPFSPLPTVADDTPLTIVAFDGQMIRCAQRPTRRAMAEHWLPTSATRLTDAGGGPIFDDRAQLVGMITKNTSRASLHLYGLHISAVRRAADVLTRELRAEQRVYCPQCGFNSRIGAAGYFYCEVCGSVLPASQNITRYPLPQAEPYYGTVSAQCTRCGASTGFHHGRCLRCGQAAAT